MSETHNTQSQPNYSPLQVAALCGLSRRRVYDWLTWGWLRGERVGGRWQVHAEDWELFRQTCRGARGRLMPSLWDWTEVWPERPRTKEAE